MISAGRLDLCEYFKEDNRLKLWMNILYKCLQISPVNSDLTKLPTNNSELEEKESNYEWKMKINASNVLLNFFCFCTRVVKSNPDNWQRATYSSFARDYSEIIIQQFFAILGQAKAKQFVSPKVLMNIMRCLYHALQIDFFVMMLHPFFDTLLFELVLPLMKVHLKDIELWSNDPVQYIYSQDCTEDEHQKLKMAAKGLIEQIMQ